MEFFGDGGGGFVDATVLRGVYISRDFVLALRVADDLFIFQHQPLALAVLVRKELVMCRGAPESALLRTVSSARISAVLEVISDLVESLFGHKVFALGAEVATVNDGVDQILWMRA